MGKSRTSPPLGGSQALPAETKCKNWDLESILDTPLPVSCALCPPSPDISSVYWDGLTHQTSQYLPVSFRAKPVSSALFQGWPKSNSDHCKPKLLRDLEEFPGRQVRLKPMLMLLLKGGELGVFIKGRKDKMEDLVVVLMCTMCCPPCTWLATCSVEWEELIPRLSGLLGRTEMTAPSREAVGFSCSFLELQD